MIAKRFGDLEYFKTHVQTYEILKRSCKLTKSKDAFLWDDVIRINDPRLLGLWCITETYKSFPTVDFKNARAKRAKLPLKTCKFVTFFSKFLQ